MSYRLLLAVVTFLFNVTILSIILQHKRKLFISLLLWSLSLVVIVSGAILLYKFGIKNRLPFFLLNIPVLASCFYLFKEKPAQILFFFFANWEFSSFTAALCKWIASAIQPIHETALTVLLLYIVIYTVLIPIILRFWKNPIREMLALFDAESPVYVLTSFTGFAIFASQFNTLSTDTSNQHVFMILLQFYIILVYYILFSYFRTLYHHIKTQQDVKGFKLVMTVQKKYYEEVEKGVRLLDKTAHDSHHHLHALRCLAQEGDLNAVSAYLDQLLQNNERTTIQRFCRNKAANAVINSYIDAARKRNITASVEVDIPESIGIDDNELGTLFGNAVENALEACNRIPADSPLFENRFIRIKTKTDAECLVIRIENSCSGAQADGVDKFKSSKESHEGIGMRSIQMIVDSYQGYMNAQILDNTFVLSIVLYPRSNGL